MVHLSREAFNKQMYKLSGIWPSEFKSAERLNRYYNAVSDVPDHVLEEITNLLMDNFRTAPLPKDFREAAEEWHKEFISRNGYKYGYDKAPEKPAEIDCSWCMDSGMLYCSETKPNGENFFMLCDCKAGKNKIDPIIPHWSKAVAAAYQRLPFQVKDWIPTGSITFMALFDIWRKKVHEGRTYWAEQRKMAKPVFRQLWTNEQHEQFLRDKKNGIQSS